MGYFKIDKKNSLCLQAQIFDLLLTSVMLSSFHIDFMWGRPRTSQENNGCTLLPYFSRDPHRMGTEY